MNDLVVISKTKDSQGYAVLFNSNAIGYIVSDDILIEPHFAPLPGIKLSKKSMLSILEQMSKRSFSFTESLKSKTSSIEESPVNVVLSKRASKKSRERVSV